MTVLATDDFAGSGALSASWTVNDGTIARASGEADFGGSQIVTARHTGAAAPANQYAQLKMGSVVDSASDNGCGPAIRIGSGTGQTADMYLLQGNTVETRVYKRVSGGYTQLGTDGPSVAPGDVLYLEAQGDQIVAKKNGTPICGSPITDSSIASGDAGVWAGASGNQANIYGDDFEAGDFNAGPVFGTATDSAEYTGASPLTFSYTAPGGTDEVLLLAVSVRSFGSTNATIDSATFNGVSLTKIIEQQNVNSLLTVAWFWLPAPAAGSHTVSVSYTVDTPGWAQATALTYTNAHQSSIDANAGSNADAASDITTTVTVATADSHAVSVMATQADGATCTLSDTQVAKIAITAGADGCVVMRAGPLSTGSKGFTVSSLGGSNAAQAVISIKPAVASSNWPHRHKTYGWARF